MAEPLIERRSAAARIGLWLGPLAAAALLAIPFGAQPETHRFAAVAVLMAVWWMTEAIPIAATALIPLVALPFLGILPSEDVAREYANDSIFLFLGGFIVALAVERWGLHRRMALGIVAAIGASPRRLVLGFMAATGFLSMGMSNTATAMLMFPIGMSIIALARQRVAPGEEPAAHTLGASLMLGIAYGASIGGVATLIGTPPNIVFQRIFAQEFPGGPDITFFNWLQLGLPVAVVFLLIGWVVLTRVAFRVGGVSTLGGAEVLRQERASLGPMSRAERRVAAVMAATALLWMTRSDMDLGFVKILGWGTLLARVPFMHVAAPETGKSLLHDATVAMLAAVSLFLIPAGDGSRRRLMDWPAAERMPYGVLLLFGGGFALARGFDVSGLSAWLGRMFAESPIASSSPLVIVAGVAGGMTFLTELTSNTATTQVALPILGSLSRAVDLNPLVVMIPATLSASFAFMLPVATPPNAIVFGSGEVRMADMIRAGLILNLIGVALVISIVYPLTMVLFDVTPQPCPAAWLAP